MSYLWIFRCASWEQGSSGLHVAKSRFFHHCLIQIFIDLWWFVVPFRYASLKMFYVFASLFLAGNLYGFVIDLGMESGIILDVVSIPFPFAHATCYTFKNKSLLLWVYMFLHSRTIGFWCFLWFCSLAFWAFIFDELSHRCSSTLAPIWHQFQCLLVIVFLWFGGVVFYGFWFKRDAMFHNP